MFVFSITEHCTFDDALGACVAWNIHCSATCALVWLAPGPAVGLPTVAMTADPNESLTVRIGTAVPVVSWKCAVKRKALAAIMKFAGMVNVGVWLMKAPEPVLELLTLPPFPTKRVIGAGQPPSVTLS